MTDEEVFNLFFERFTIHVLNDKDIINYLLVHADNFTYLKAALSTCRLGVSEPALTGVKPK